MTAHGECTWGLECDELLSNRKVHPFGLKYNKIGGSQCRLFTILLLSQRGLTPT